MWVSAQNSFVGIRSEPQDRLKGKKKGFVFVDAFPSEINRQCFGRVVYKYAIVQRVKGHAKINVCFRLTAPRQGTRIYCVQYYEGRAS